MDTQAIFETLQTFAMLLLGLLAWYFSVSQKAQAKAEKAQAKAFRFNLRSWRCE